MSIAQSNRAGLFFVLTRQLTNDKELVAWAHYHPHTTNQLEHTRDQAKQTNPPNQSN